MYACAVTKRNIPRSLCACVWEREGGRGKQRGSVRKSSDIVTAWETTSNPRLDIKNWQLPVYIWHQFHALHHLQHLWGSNLTLLFSLILLCWLVMLQLVKVFVFSWSFGRYYKVVSSAENYSDILSKLRDAGIPCEPDNGSELLPINPIEVSKWICILSSHY